MTAKLKHSPATSLPWAALNDEIRKPQTHAVEDRVAALIWEKKDRDYLVHAANAYPKLVENQKKLNAQMVEIQKWAQDCRERGVKIDASALWSKLNGIVWNAALLRELGEAE